MIFHMASCGGCRTCEMACSFRHTGEFAPAVSSIRILDKADGHGFEVSLAEDGYEKRRICDGCHGLEEPFCVQYCEKAEDLEAILKEFLTGCAQGPNQEVDRGLS
jgi:Fe-S-cluster-containing hydrogenase component 2